VLRWNRTRRCRELRYSDGHKLSAARVTFRDLDTAAPRGYSSLQQSVCALTLHRYCSHCACTPFLTVDVKVIAVPASNLQPLSWPGPYHTNQVPPVSLNSCFFQPDRPMVLASTTPQNFHVVPHLEIPITLDISIS
jgi:hypothetical protein